MSTYFIEDTYNGSVITVNVDRDTGTFDSSSGPVSLHTIIGLIDSVEQVTEDAPLDPVDGRPGLTERIAAVIQSLKDEVDGLDEFEQVMDDLGFVSGSHAVQDYVVTPVSGGFTHTWTDDTAIDFIESLQQADDAAFTVNLTTIHSGALAPPITDSSYGSGVTKYFRMRGQKTGFPVGPWSYASGTSL